MNLYKKYPWRIFLSFLNKKNLEILMRIQRIQISKIQIKKVYNYLSKIRTKMNYKQRKRVKDIYSHHQAAQKINYSFKNFDNQDSTPNIKP